MVFYLSAQIGNTQNNDSGVGIEENKIGHLQSSSCTVETVDNN